MLASAGAAHAADVVHFQWLTMPWLDGGLLPDRPLVLTATTCCRVSRDPARRGRSGGC